MNTAQHANLLPPGPQTWSLVDQLRVTLLPSAQVLGEMAQTYGNTFRVVIPEEAVTFAIRRLQTMMV